MADPFIGEIRMFGGNFAPLGWALCHGQIVSISQNDALFALLGTTYGGDGQTTFALPDLRGRAPIHKGAGAGLTPRVIGQALGAESVTLTAAQMPLHSHDRVASTNAASTASGPGAAPGASATTNFYAGGNVDVAMAAAVGAAGGGQPHDNMAPYQVLNFIIAMEGIFPSRN